MTKRDYANMARWISENTTDYEEYRHIRETVIGFACHIAKEADKSKGNQERFDEERFRMTIKTFDQEKEG